MSQSLQLTRDLFDDRITPQQSREFLDRVSDPAVTYETAAYFGNDTPRPPARFYYDKSLSGTGALAWYLDPREVSEVHPAYGKRLESELGSEPIMAINPDVAIHYYNGRIKDFDFIRALDNHEKTHGAQQGKQVLKNLCARTQYGDIPVGLMLVEGAVEYALDRRHDEMSKKGIRTPKAPSRYFDEMSDEKPLYSTYRDFVYELEENYHGITRQLFRAAKRGGANAVIRLLEEIPDIDNIVNKYAYKLNVENATALAA